MGADFLMGSSKTRSRTDQPVSSALEVCVYDVNVKHSGQIIHKIYSKLVLRFKWGSQHSCLPTNGRFWHTESSYAVLLWIRKRIMVSRQANEMIRHPSHNTQHLAKLKVQGQNKHICPNYTAENTFSVTFVLYSVFYILHISTHCNFITKQNDI